jgi:lipopolysaccharide transport system permease protein
MKADIQSAYNGTLPQNAESETWQVIHSENRWVPLNLRELWAYRELLFFLTWRDIKVRYKQTLLGVSWAIVQPFMQMVVFSVFFGTLAQMDSEGVPYPLFNYAALLPWTYFAGSLAKSAGSVVGSGSLIKKVYFPRLIVPISGVLGGLPDFLLSFLVMLGLMLYYNFAPNIMSFVLLLPLLLLAMITALGVGLWLSALNALYRDVGYITPFLIQLWLFITPVVYSADLIENPLARTLYGLNPMVGVVQGFRTVLLGTNNTLDAMLLVSVAASFVILVTGLYFYRRMEAVFADVV